ncbi:hypothetical protein SDC9_211228 [bioreactor metagenome]|uniref:Uncharacterized protein n=1 Tax=bioreactor metagenome TaxID=1076179 RepID=A0A645JL72_9ZZZZ
MRSILKKQFSGLVGISQARGHFLPACAQLRNFQGTVVGGDIQEISIAYLCSICACLLNGPADGVGCRFSVEKSENQGKSHHGDQHEINGADQCAAVRGARDKHDI